MMMVNIHPILSFSSLNDSLVSYVRTGSAHSCLCTVRLPFLFFC